MRWIVLALVAMVLSLSGCSLKEVPPNTDPEVAKREQEKLDKMRRESGETR